MMSIKMWHVNFIMAVVMAVLVLSAVDANAEGDKTREGNIVFCDDGEPCGIVVPIDCTKEFSPQSGAAVYFCVEEDED